MSNIVSTNLRFNLDREDDRRAWEHLQKMDRREYRSYSRAAIIAINDFFDRQTHQDDPYLETRSKEDAFLKRVLDTIDLGIRNVAPISFLSLAQNIQPQAAPPQEDTSGGYGCGDGLHRELLISTKFNGY